MDNQRLLVWAAFGMMIWFTYQAWMEDYGPKPVPQVAEQAEQAEETAPAATEDLSLPELGDDTAAPGEAPGGSQPRAAGPPSAPRDDPGPVLTQGMEVEI